jgi:PKD repeat protein
MSAKNQMTGDEHNKRSLYRIVEQAAIAVTLIVVLILLILSGDKTSIQGLASENFISISAYAHAMPDQGWAPLTVYYSAFGSTSVGGKITKYEWDLDGNGAFDFSVTEPGGYAQYTYSKPGTYVISLRVTDQAGHSAMDQTEIKVLHPTASSVDYWKVFQNDSIRKITFRLSQEAWNRLWEDIEAKVTVPVNVDIFGQEFSEVGLRMRGQFSLRESGQKKPWKIDMDYYIPGQEYSNLKQLLFINNIGDPTLLREKIAYEMMQFAGLPASFTSYVEIWFDISDDAQPAEFWGVYTMIERVDRKFLANRFGQDAKDGNLYKASHAQRGPMDLVYYGDSIDDFPHQNGQVAYGKMTNEEAADYSDIVELTRVIDGTNYKTPQEFADALEEIFEVDSFLRYMAVVDATMNWDVYPYTGNNYFLFNNQDTGKFEWIPWDLTWGDNPNHPVFEATETGLIERRPLHTRVFQVPEYRLAYAAYIDLLIRHFFNPQVIGEKARSYQAMINPLLLQNGGDKMFSSPFDFSPESYNGSWQELVNLVEQRNLYLQTAILDYKNVPVWRSQSINLENLSEGEQPFDDENLTGH